MCLSMSLVLVIYRISYMLSPPTTKQIVMGFLQRTYLKSDTLMNEKFWSISKHLYTQIWASEADKWWYHDYYPNPPDLISCCEYLIVLQNYYHHLDIYLLINWKVYEPRERLIKHSAIMNELKNIWRNDKRYCSVGVTESFLSCTKNPTFSIHEALDIHVPSQLPVAHSIRHVQQSDVPFRWLHRSR